VPLIADQTRAAGGDGRRCPLRNHRYAGIPPEAQATVGIGHPEGPVIRAVDHEDVARERVLWPPSVARRTVAWIAPGARPRRRIGRIDDRVVVRLFVGNERAIGGAAAVNGVLVARFPERLIAA